MKLSPLDERLKSDGELLDCVDQLLIPAKYKKRVNYVGFCVLKYAENENRKPVFLVKRVYNIKDSIGSIKSYRWSACIVERTCNTQDEAKAAMVELLEKIKEKA